MSLASKPASRWAVSARTNGEVLTAGISRPDLELVVLGIPAGFSQPEIEAWLHDLAGVAVETSHADARTRAIPPLMHHALTGLLFSHAELWDRLDAPKPCSCAFVDQPGGAAFGWFGEARVHVLVDGDPVEPRWVRVRDEAGREANATVFAPGADVVVTLQYWPNGDDGGVAPASIEAEWVVATSGSQASASWPAAPVAALGRSKPSPQAAPDPTLIEPRDVPQVGEPAPMIESPIAHEIYPELPESLPVQQPSLATPVRELPRDPRDPGPLATLIVPLGEDPVPADSDEPLPGLELRASSSPARAFFDDMDQYAPAPTRREQFAEPLVSDPFSLDASVQGRSEPEPDPFVPHRTAPAPFATDVPASRPASSASQAMKTIGSPSPSRRPIAAAPIAPPAPKPSHPVARWLARVMKWGRPAEPEPDLVSADPESAPVSAYDSLLSDSVPPTPPERPEFDLASDAPPAGFPAAPTMHSPGGLRSAGLAEILGGASSSSAAFTPGAQDSHAVPGTPGTRSPQNSPASPSGSIAINERLQDLLREIEAADAGHLPVISPQLPVDAAARSLDIDHEPVGADETFGIPRLPSSPSPRPREEDRISSIPKLPTARAAAPSPPPEHREPAPLPESFVSPIGALDDAEIAPEMIAPAPVPAVSPASTPAPVPAAAAPRPAAELSPDSPPMLRVPVPARAPSGGDAAVPAYEAGSGDAPSPPIAPDAVQDDFLPVAPRAPRRPRSLDVSESFEAPKPPLHRRPLVWAAGVVIVFVVGWLVGGFSGPGTERGGPFASVLHAIGIGGAHFTVSINSSPGGAQIEIDGKPQSTRTPATLELPPGEHVVKLLMPGLGAVEVPLRGRNGEKRTVDESLNGSLEILDTDTAVPISISIDGKPAGYAPLKIESIAPGLHEVGFTGPGMPAWAQTIQVDVRGSAQLVARPMTAPASGVIQAQATLNDEQGASPLAGAQVYVDGDLRGVTPMTIELPRGPHSLRVVYRGETAPVQVIDLPGGNQRFASFNFGLDLVSATLTLLGNTRTFAPGETKVVSASLQGLSANDVSEAWLHVRTPEGLWRRYSMTLLRGADNLVVTAVFPESIFDSQGNTRWYVRVISRLGDETFSELQRSSLAVPGAKPAARPRP
jgi:hypothetical protein